MDQGAPICEITSLPSAWIERHRSDPAIGQPPRSKESAICESSRSNPFGTHHLLQESLLFLRSCYIFFAGARALLFSSTWMLSVAESVKFSEECFCGSFHEVCPAFVSTSFVVPSGRVNRMWKSVREMSTYAGCSCMGTFSCGPVRQCSTRTCAFSNSTLQCFGSTFAGSCAKATDPAKHTPATSKNV